jgi:hypothetical protein
MTREPDTSQRGVQGNKQAAAQERKKRLADALRANIAKRKSAKDRGPVGGPKDG